MGALLIIISISLAIYLSHYIRTLPERRENKEKLRRELLLCEEKCQAERAKQISRIAGAITRENIDKIAKLSISTQGRNCNEKNKN